LFDVVAIDMAFQSDDATSEFKTDQAPRLLKHIDATTPPEIVGYHHDLAKAILDLSNQLFIQAFLTILLVERLVPTATLFYVLRAPTELAKFHWIVDAKDIGGTKYERLWGNLVLPLAQSQSTKEPFPTIEGGDYSHFSRFFVNEASLPEHLTAHSRSQGGLTFGLIMAEEFTLGDSKVISGLRLVDILAAAFTRAINGSLRVDGWRGLGRLMVTRNTDTLAFARLKAGGISLVLDAPYTRVVRELVAETKSMFPVSSWGQRYPPLA